MTRAAATRSLEVKKAVTFVDISTKWTALFYLINCVIRISTPSGRFPIEQRRVRFAVFLRLLQKLRQLHPTRKSHPPFQSLQS